MQYAVHIQTYDSIALIIECSNLNLHMHLNPKSHIYGNYMYEHTQYEVW